MTLRDRKRTAELMDCLGDVRVEAVISHGRLRCVSMWIVERKDKRFRVLSSRELQIEWTKGKGRSTKT